MGSDRIGGIRGVYFDAGGTLLYPHPSVGEIYALVLERWGVSLAPGRLQEAFKVSWVHATRNPRNFTSEESEKQWWRKLVLHTLTGQAMPSDFDGFFEDLYVTFASAEYWKLHEGARECLRALRQSGLKTGIISNWDHRLRKILAGLPLLSELDEIIISSEVGCEKPSPRIFEEGARRWGFQPAELLYVGDSVHHDMEPSRRLGWSAVLINAHEPAPEGVVEVRALAEIPALLGARASA